MSFSFPSSPSVNDQSVQNGRTYQWDGYVWNLVGNISNHASSHAAAGSDPLTITSSQISNFNSSVSGLLPTIANSGDNRILTSTGTTTGINAESSLTFDGTSLAVPSGSAAAPGLIAVGDPNTGLYFGAADSVSISTSGVQRFHVNSSGNIGIGSAAALSRTLTLGKNITGGISTQGILQQGYVQSDVTSNAIGVYNIMNIASTSGYTLPLYTHFTAAANPPAGGAAVSYQVGFQVGAAMTGAIYNWGFRGTLASSASNWNMYMDGTAQNYILGNVGIGTGKTAPSCALDVNGLITANSGNFTTNVQVGSNTLTSTNTLNMINSANLYLWSNFR